VVDEVRRTAAVFFGIFTTGSGVRAGTTTTAVCGMNVLLAFFSAFSVDDLIHWPAVSRLGCGLVASLEGRWFAPVDLRIGLLGNLETLGTPVRRGILEATTGCNGIFRTTITGGGKGVEDDEEEFDDELSDDESSDITEVVNVFGCFTVCFDFGFTFFTDRRFIGEVTFAITWSAVHLCGTLESPFTTLD
jgi:hypothetical protein